MKRSIEAIDLRRLLNRWVEFNLYNGQSIYMYLTYTDPSYIGGYLLRSAVRAISGPTHEPTWVNQWVCMGDRNPPPPSFYLTTINKDFAGGFLIRSAVLTADLTVLRYQQFFEDYDLRFHPALLMENERIPEEERKPRSELVIRAESLLSERSSVREKAARAGKIPDPKDLPQLDMKDLKYLSDKQLELYRDYFANTAGRLDYKGIQQTFEMFDNGELQNNKYPGSLQPDSAADFLFAEFALHAIENRIDLEIWAELLKTFVKTQVIFIQVYCPNGVAKPKLADYSYTNFKSEKQVNEAFKAQLRKKFDIMTPKQLEREYGSNLLLAQGLVQGMTDESQGGVV